MGDKLGREQSEGPAHWCAQVGRATWCEALWGENAVHSPVCLQRASSALSLCRIHCAALRKSLPISESHLPHLKTRELERVVPVPASF